MSFEWKATTLGEICRFAAGSAFPPDQQGGLTGEHPFIKVSDMNLPGNEVFVRAANNFVTSDQRRVMKAKLHPTSATVFAKIGVALMSNRRRLLTRPTILDNNMMSATANESEVTPRFLYFLMTALDFNTISAGTALPYLNVSDLQRMKVWVPGLHTQTVVEQFLGALDDRIALLRETNATLEAIAQALFKSWFVDFDPVCAKQQGLVPAGTAEAAASLFPDGTEPSALGLIPRRWQVQAVGDVVACVGGTTPDTKELSYWEPEEHAWTTPKDLSGLPAPVLLTTERRLSTKGLARIGSGLLPEGTLLMSSRAPIGYLAITRMPVAINQGYIAMTPGSLLPPLYMLYWCRYNMEGIKARANGSTFMEISKKAFRPIPILVPPADVVDAFMTTASPLFDRLVENARQVQTLAALRDALLPRLISGQLRLPEAEAALAET